MRNEFVAVRVYQAVKNPATTDEFASDFSFMPEQTVRTHHGCCLHNSLIFIRFAKNISREFVCSSPPFCLLCKSISHVLQFWIWIFMTHPTIPYRSFANGDLHRCQAFQRVAPKIKNKWLNCLFKYSASATLQVYALNSAVEHLCCPSVNISHLVWEGGFMTLV